jgi:hypothetical protein
MWNSSRPGMKLQPSAYLRPPLLPPQPGRIRSARRRGPRRWLSPGRRGRAEAAGPGCRSRIRRLHGAGTGRAGPPSDFVPSSSRGGITPPHHRRGSGRFGCVRRTRHRPPPWGRRRSLRRELRRGPAPRHVPCSRSSGSRSTRAAAQTCAAIGDARPRNAPTVISPAASRERSRRCRADRTVGSGGRRAAIHARRASR